MDEQKELIRNLLFSSTNMAAMTSRENHLLDEKSSKNLSNDRACPNKALFRAIGAIIWKQQKLRDDRDGPTQILFRPAIRIVIWEPALSKVNWFAR